MTATVIKMSIQRMICTGCGAEANASCNCGKAYMPASVRASEAIAANPDKSDRAIAEELGVSPTTVGKARGAQVSSSGHVTERTGRDGKQYSVKQRSPAVRDIGLDQFDATILELVRRTKGQAANRFAKTAVPFRDLIALANLLTKIARATGEERKAEYAAAEVVV